MILALGACANPQQSQSAPSAMPVSNSPTATAPHETGLLEVQSVAVNSVANGLEAQMSGWLADACTSFDSVEQSRQGNTITLIVETRRPAGLVCSEERRYYERNVVLEGEFEEGEYLLLVNGLEVQFSVGVSETQVEGLAFVTEVRVEMDTGLVTLLVSGFVADGCTELAEVRQERLGGVVMVTMTTLREGKALCGEAGFGFVKRVELEGSFRRGEYEVRVNGVVAVFEVE